MLLMVTWLGFLPRWFTPLWLAIFTSTNIIFYALIKTGLNLRLRDPSMTMGQMAVAIAAVALILYHADAIRGGMLMLLLVILLFGVLRLTTAQLLAMGALSSAAYALVIVLLTAHKPQQISPSVEWTQWATLTATLAVMGPLVGYMSHVRRRLSESLRMIRDMAERDALTGAFNRHHMEEMLDREVSRCERGAPAFVLLIADIDHFKRINDSYGHLVGDLVLKTAAHAMRDVLRKADYMARYGGEEFVMLIAAHNPVEAKVACERLRVQVERLRPPELGTHNVTISIGGTAYRSGDTQAALLGRADAALYRAKNSGRNRVEFDLPMTE
ncbi:MAG TPA: GGDEF domain-containing protein [Alicycliphilus sp.]|nr:GGDEF domain-containing protein [Alicycliphilus sp.]